MNVRRERCSNLTDNINGLGTTVEVVEGGKRLQPLLSFLLGRIFIIVVQNSPNMEGENREIGNGTFSLVSKELEDIANGSEG